MIAWQKSATAVNKRDYIAAVLDHEPRAKYMVIGTIMRH